MDAAPFDPLGLRNAAVSILRTCSMPLLRHMKQRVADRYLSRAGLSEPGPLDCDKHSFLLIRRVGRPQWVGYIDTGTPGHPH